jgi:hypothetical protein
MNTARYVVIEYRTANKFPQQGRIWDHGLLRKGKWLHPAQE